MQRYGRGSQGIGETLNGGAELLFSCARPPAPPPAVKSCAHTRFFGLFARVLPLILDSALASRRGRAARRRLFDQGQLDQGQWRRKDGQPSSHYLASRSL